MAKTPTPKKPSPAKKKAPAKKYANTKLAGLSEEERKAHTNLQKKLSKRRQRAKKAGKDENAPVRPRQCLAGWTEEEKKARRKQQKEASRLTVFPRSPGRRP